MRNLVIAMLMAAAGLAQPARHGSVERIKVHGQGLERNLEGDSPDREAAVFLPPGYKPDSGPRYPVLYLLHGFTDNVEKWWGTAQHFVNVPAAVNASLAAGVREMIVVMPDAFTRYEGSMYSNSPTTGDWEGFVAKELVAYIDAHYRTVPERMGRGLAGHSMGGYGAIKIGMRHPEVYSSLYLMSPCCMAVGTARANARAEAYQGGDVSKLDFGTQVALASAAAWSPNPKNPPLFFDLPYSNGVVREEIAAKWNANAPLAMIDQYIGNLRQYAAIGMDAGILDRPIVDTVRTLDQILTDYGVKHVAETYDGNHVNRIAERLEKKVLPFFSANLKWLVY